MGRATNSSPKLKIHLENEQLVMYGSPSESSGCVLRGALTLRLNKPTSLKALSLSFQGTMSVSWNQCKYERDRFNASHLIAVFSSIRKRL